MEPRRARRQPADRRDAGRRPTLRSPATPEPPLPGPPPAAGEPAPPTPPHSHRRVRTRGWVTLGAVAAVLVVVLVVVLHHPVGRHTGGGTAPPSGSPPQASTPPHASASWHTLASGGGSAPTVASLAADPDGSLWLVTTAAGGPDRLVHISGGAPSGAYALSPAPALPATPRIQTVGTAHVWLVTDTARELAFNKAALTFRAYSTVPASDAVTVGGYSVGLYGGGSSPYVLVAALGAASAQHVSLGSTTFHGAYATDLVAGPSGTALAIVGTSVWQVDPATATATAWGTVPATNAAAWTAGRLWLLQKTGTGWLLDSESAGGAPRAAHLPATDVPVAPAEVLVTSGGRLWWPAAGAVVSYDPSSGAVASTPLPTTGRVLLAPDPAGGVWAAVGDRFALLG